MVRAIRDGSKMQTRRVIKPPPPPSAYDPSLNEDGLWEWCDDIDPLPEHVHRSPYGVPGDRLWVCETWAAPSNCDTVKPSDLAAETSIWYHAGGVRYPEDEDTSPGRGRPSIHMPRWASRITLEVTDVRVERVQEISEKNILAEGVRPYMVDSGGQNPDGSWVDIPDYYMPWIRLWDSINAKRGFGWGDNPWVLVVTFKKWES